MKLLDLEKFETSINNELLDLKSKIDSVNERIAVLDAIAGSADTLEYVQVTKQVHKLYGRHRGLRQSLSIASELAVSI